MTDTVLHTLEQITDQFPEYGIFVSNGGRNLNAVLLELETLSVYEITDRSINPYIAVADGYRRPSNPLIEDNDVDIQFETPWHTSGTERVPNHNEEETGTDKDYGWKFAYTDVEIDPSAQNTYYEERVE